MSRAAELAAGEGDPGRDWETLKSQAVGAEGAIIAALERHGFPHPIDQHAVIRNAEGAPVAEADLLYPNRIVVWIHGSPHHLGHVSRRDAELERQLRSLGYRVVTIWPERPEEGLRALAERLQRPDLIPRRPALRLVTREEAEPYARHLPVYDLQAAAGAFSEGQVPEELGWVEVDGRKLHEGMFVARVVGKSMNRRIPDGAYCIFRSPVEGSRNGRVLLVQHRDIADPEHGGQYTVKIYESDKEASEDGQWRHAVIRLKPASFEPGFEPILLRMDQEEEIAVIAELVDVLQA